MGRLHQRSCLILGAFWLVLPGTVWASPPDMEVLLTGQVETDASGEQVVALRFLNRTDRQEILALPIYPELTPEMKQYVAQTVLDFYA